MSNVLKDKRVLVVEDNEINQLVIRHLLNKMGAQPEITSSGEAAIDILRAHSFDLILMDIQLDGMDGYDTSAYIRNELNIQTPIIALTAHYFIGEDPKGKACGMNTHISKPVTIDNLERTLKTLSFSDNSAPHTLSANGITVDVSMVYDVAGNDETYINLMIGTFLKSMPVSISNMEQFCDKKDYNNLYLTAHSMKTTISVIKVNQMLDWVIAIEQSAKNKVGLPLIPSLIAKVKQRYLLAEKLLLEQWGALV